ncbi:MAG TPA: metal ABC transporter permease [Polyangiaceae bacterium]|nr:metal ABC transporter permease [Polyangiaceae bacterium]
MNPGATAKATPSAQPDEFDAILASPSASAQPAAAATTSAKPHAEIAVDSHAAADLADFAENWGIYRDPVLCGVLAGAGLAALGVFVVLRRAVFMTAALSQAAGLGVAFAFYAEIHLGFSFSPVFGALLASVATTQLVGSRPRARLAPETLVGFAFVAASALAVLLGDRIAQEAHDIAAILFGTAVLVRPLDLWLLAGGTALTFLTLSLLGRGLVFSGFDPEGARVHGLPVRAIEGGFWTLFALEVSLATRALGSLPVFAFSVLPAAAGLLLANRLRSVVVVAVGLGVAAGGLGYVAAFLFSLPVGASQATLCAVFASAAYAWARLRRY